MPPSGTKYVALNTVKLTEDVAKANGMSKAFLAPGEVVVMSKAKAMPWIKSGSLESVAKRKVREDLELMDLED